MSSVAMFSFYMCQKALDRSWSLCANGYTHSGMLPQLECWRWPQGYWLPCCRRHASCKTSRVDQQPCSCVTRCRRYWVPCIWEEGFRRGWMVRSTCAYWRRGNTCWRQAFIELSSDFEPGWAGLAVVVVMHFRHRIGSVDVGINICSLSVGAH